MIRAFRCPYLILLASLAASAIALVSSYIAEYGFGLEPCILCLYQRVPFAAAIALSLGFFALNTMNHDTAKKHAFLFVLMSGLLYAINSAIAFYHSGVERKWWASHLEGCTVSFEKSSAEDLLSTIIAAPSVRCDEVPWADPILGLSMANYNVLFSAGLALICACIALTNLRHPSLEA